MKDNIEMYIKIIIKDISHNATVIVMKTKIISKKIHSECML